MMNLLNNNSINTRHIVSLIWAGKAWKPQVPTYSIIKYLPIRYLFDRKSIKKFSLWFFLFKGLNLNKIMIKNVMITLMIILWSTNWKKNIIIQTKNQKGDQADDWSHECLEYLYDNGQIWLPGFVRNYPFQIIKYSKKLS